MIKRQAAEHQSEIRELIERVNTALSTAPTLPVKVPGSTYPAVNREVMRLLSEAQWKAQEVAEGDDIYIILS